MILHDRFRTSSQCPQLAQPSRAVRQAWEFENRRLLVLAAAPEAVIGDTAPYLSYFPDPQLSCQPISAPVQPAKGLCACGKRGARVTRRAVSVVSIGADQSHSSAMASWPVRGSSTINP